MAVTVYNLKSTSSASGWLLNHQNTSGAAERVIINYIKTTGGNVSAGLMQFYWGPSATDTLSDFLTIQVDAVNSFGKNIAYVGNVSQSVMFQGQNLELGSVGWQSQNRSAPTEIMLADQEYFKIYWGSKANFITACNIVVIPEGG